MRTLILFLLSFVVIAQNQHNFQIKVQGEGIVSAPIDVIELQISVQNEDVLPALAKKQNDQQIQKIISFLKQKQVKHKMTFNTRRISLNKSYDYHRREDQQQSYSASQTIFISLEDLDFYDSLMLNLLDLGITSIDYVSFSVQDKKSLEEQSRNLAIDDAYKKALQYVQRAGAKLGKVVMIEENDINLSDRVIVGASYSEGYSKNSMGYKAQDFKVKSQIFVVYELINP